MKKFLFQTIVIIFIPVIIVLGTIEIIIRNTPNEYSYKRNWIMQNHKDVKILSFGSSHSYYGIRPDFFSKKAFNFAFVSQSLKYDEFLFDKYATHCDSLEYVILPISYFSLRQNLEEGEEAWRVKCYCIYMNCDDHAFSPKYHLEITSKNKVRQVKDIICGHKNFVYCDSLGWGENALKSYRAANWEKTAKVACVRHSKEKKEYVIENIQYIESIIRYCDERGIKVLLLTLPTYYTYYKILNNEQLNEMIFICNNFAARYNNVIYLNLLKSDTFTEEDFFDADHLNEYGAAKLTKMLDEYMSFW